MKQITTLLLLCSLQVQRPCDHYHRGADCFSHWELRSRSPRAEVVLSPGQLENHSIERSSLKTIKHDLYQNQDPDPPTCREKKKETIFLIGNWDRGRREQKLFCPLNPEYCSSTLSIFNSTPSIKSNQTQTLHFILIALNCALSNISSMAFCILL